MIFAPEFFLVVSLACAGVALWRRENLIRGTLLVALGSLALGAVLFVLYALLRLIF